MKKLLLATLFFLSPMIASPFSEPTHSAEMWWCSNCELAYPASQKVCLNKNCPLFRKKR